MTQFRPPSFQILPTVIKNLLIINVLVFLAQNTIKIDGFSFNDTFALHTFQSPLFKPWQFVTHMFMHANFDHIFGNMLGLWMFGSVLENVWGPKRFLTFYIVCGLGAALCHMGVLYYENAVMIKAFRAIDNGAGDYFGKLQQFVAEYSVGLKGNIGYNEETANAILYLKLNTPTIGASGAVFGCLAAFAYMYPNSIIFTPIPLKAKWAILIYAAFEFYALIGNSAGSSIAHAAHLGGALVGFLLVYFWNKNNRKTFY